MIGREAALAVGPDSNVQADLKSLKDLMTE